MWLDFSVRTIFKAKQKLFIRNSYRGSDQRVCIHKERIWGCKNREATMWHTAHHHATNHCYRLEQCRSNSFCVFFVWQKIFCVNCRQTFFASMSRCVCHERWHYKTHDATSRAVTQKQEAGCCVGVEIEPVSCCINSYYLLFQRHMDCQRVCLMLCRRHFLNTRGKDTCLHCLAPSECFSSSSLGFEACRWKTFTYVYLFHDFQLPFFCRVQESLRCNQGFFYILPRDPAGPKVRLYDGQNKQLWV